MSVFFDSILFNKNIWLSQMIVPVQQAAIALAFLILIQIKQLIAYRPEAAIFTGNDDLWWS